ncbi:MAG: type II secretion system protein [Candidatus Saccharimonadales bacterium]
MNTPYKQSDQTTKGFTIIEVVLVLAIAGLIFLMVFLALPALQRSQRDTDRKNALSRISTQLVNYQTSNRGGIPDETKLTARDSGFVTKYLGGNVSVAGSEYIDPSSGDGYTLSYNDNSSDTPDAGEIFYATGKLCGLDGAITNGTGRQYALRIKLEGQTSSYCVDNR